MSDRKDHLARRRALFVQDARRRLATLNASLLALEQDPADQAALEAALYALHTLKGNAGLAELETLATTAHALESALLYAQSEPDSISVSGFHTLLLRGLEALYAMVALLTEQCDERIGPASIPVLDVLALGPLQETTWSSAKAPTLAGGGESLPDTVAVRAHHLDDLLELAEELEAQQSRLARTQTEAQTLALARQRRLLHQLTDTILQTRTLPLRFAFEGYERLVRDLCASTGRQARLEVEGGETQIDRSVLEPIRDLIVHLVRNAVAHGLESPADRLAAGKPAGGTIRVCARPEKDGATIEVSDDGRGLDRRQVAARAVELGFCTPAQASEMTDAQLWTYLTRPGFTTYGRDADAIAGRGMGLSAMREGMEALNGQLQIASSSGQGTTVRLWLPSALALQEAVLIQVGRETYALLQASVERADPASQPIPDDVPVLDLWQRLDVPGEPPPTMRTLLFCRRANGRVALPIDGIVARDQVVIRPLSRRAWRPGLLGAVITAAGQVVLVLDLDTL